jgi:predicted secreted protein
MIKKYWSCIFVFVVLFWINGFCLFAIESRKDFIVHEVSIDENDNNDETVFRNITCLVLGTGIVAGVIIAMFYFKPFFNSIRLKVGDTLVYSGNDFEEGKRRVQEYFEKRGIRDHVFAQEH